MLIPVLDPQNRLIVVLSFKVDEVVSCKPDFPFIAFEPLPSSSDKTQMNLLCYPITLWEKNVVSKKKVFLTLLIFSYFSIARLNNITRSNLG